jgi:CRP-like cAMP-binding protein
MHPAENIIEIMDIHRMMESRLFEGISEEELTEMVYSNPGNIKEYKRGAIIAHQGDEVKGLMILSEGVVNNLLGEEGKKKVIVKTLQAPTFMVPAFIFATDPRFITTVQAAVDSEVVLIPRDRLLRYARRNNQLMLNIVREISDRFQFLALRIADFTTMTLKDRLLKYIKENGPITNQTELAQRMGVARPSLSRALSELQKEGKI